MAKKFFTIETRWDEEEIQEGKDYILAYIWYEGSPKGFYQLRPDNGEGISANMDRNIKRYHGHRGTTDGRAVYAEGVRRVEEIISKKEIQYGYGGYSYKVRLSKDLKPDEP